MWTQEGFWFWNAVISLVSTVLIHFLIKERNPSHDEFSSPLEVVRNVSLDSQF